MVHKVPVEHPHRGVVADQIGDSGQLGQGGYMVQYTAPAVHRRPEPFQYLPVPVPKGDGTAVQLRQPDLSQLGQRIHGMTVELDLLHLSQYAVPVFFLPVRREQAHSSSQKVKLVLIQKQGWGHIPHLVEHHSGLRETLLKIPAQLDHLRLAGVGAKAHPDCAAALGNGRQVVLEQTIPPQDSLNMG